MQAVFFDFDGVLSQDRFYATIAETYPQITEYVDNVIFRGQEKYSDQWMRGELSYHDINRMVSQATRLPVKLMTELALQLKQKGIPIALVTNNMDVFNEITIPTHKLDKIFPVIINSADHGALKHERNGLLFDLALEGLGLNSFKDILLIDDSEKACAMFKSKGGTVYRFTDLETFKEWRTQEWQKLA